MAPGKRHPAPIGTLLERWIRKNNLGDDLLKHTLRHRWPEVVGERLAARTRPAGLYRGRLTVLVASSPPCSGNHVDAVTTSSVLWS